MLLVKAMSFRIMKILCSLIKPHRCLDRVDESSAAYRLLQWLGLYRKPGLVILKIFFFPLYLNVKEKGHPMTQAAWMLKDFIGLSQM